MNNSLIEGAFNELMDLVQDSIANNQFIRIVMSERRDAGSELMSVKGSMVVIKDMLRLKLDYRYKTREETKHFDPAEGGKEIIVLLEKEFRQVNIFTTREHRHIVVKKGDKIKVNRMTYGFDKVIPKTGVHDRLKHRFVNVNENIYLTELGVTLADGQVKKNMEGKFRQIDKYVEIVDSIIQQAELPKEVTVTDMGSGKGYLTFALYDHMRYKLKMDVKMTGVEFRDELVEECNVIAHKAGFRDLRFVSGNIYEVEIERTDILIALHACDTATDDAIYRGITHDARIIICAPCCHKQLRRQIAPQNILRQITQHGILAERQAEVLTDTIRALILEAYGYKTKVFEFISGAHTAKNVMIAAVKTKDIVLPDAAILLQVDELKEMFGIKEQQLETLLKL